MSDLLDQFSTALAGTDGVSHYAASPHAAVKLANELVGDATVARWEDDLVVEIGITTGPPEVADYSVIAADLGIATTGAIGFTHQAGRARAVGLLPPRQIALLPEDRIVDEVSSALLSIFRDRNSQPPSNLVFVAGPSRTSDIQQRSIRGMHAPKTLDVIIYRR